jgi:predicted alpha/beta-fold hydrolase
VGFSLGGNIVLRFAGECGSTALPNLRAVATIGPPIDLVRCSEMISRLRFYDAFYVRHLVRQVTEHHRWFPDLPVVAFPRRTTLRMFDDLYTAPRWGYADALDYYRQASALSGMGAIRVPTYILTARDDPFVAVQPFEELTPNPAVEVHISAHGGHLGFLGVDGIGGIRWAETQLVSWLTNMVAKRPLN